MNCQCVDHKRKVETSHAKPTSHCRGVLRRVTFIQGLTEGTCSGWDVKARGQVGLLERLLWSLYTLGLVLINKLLWNYRSKRADEGLTRHSLLLAYLRIAD